MEQSGPGGTFLARIASPFINGIKRVATDFGILTDKQGYEEEIVRYEGTLRMPAGPESEPQLEVETADREAATS